MFQNVNGAKFVDLWNKKGVDIDKIISEYNTLGYKEAKTRAFNIGRKMVSIISIISFLLLLSHRE